jgi:putative endonuclease
MFVVYLLRSRNFPEKVYVGLTTDLHRRLAQHNGGAEKGYASKYAPWNVIVAIHFENRTRAEAFERYLKSGSGHSFAKRHFW